MLYHIFGNGLIQQPGAGEQQQLLVLTVVPVQVNLANLLVLEVGVPTPGTGTQ